MSWSASEVTFPDLVLATITHLGTALDVPAGSTDATLTTPHLTVSRAGGKRRQKILEDVRLAVVVHHTTRPAAAELAADVAAVVHSMSGRYGACVVYRVADAELGEATDTVLEEPTFELLFDVTHRGTTAGS